MSRLLIRAAKAPWVSTSAEAVLAQNLINTNVGNLLFGQSVYRMLSVPGAEVVAESYLTGRNGIDAKYIGRINDEFDGFVVPLANAFRRGFRRNLKNLTHVIERLDMPVTVVGVGSQHPLEADSHSGDPMAEDVKRFMTAVLDRSASVGVRGELTARYLKNLGFGDEHVDVIGCPSVYLNGPDLNVRAHREPLGKESRIAVSMSPLVDTMLPIIQRHADQYRNLVYIPQDTWDLAALMWGESTKSETPAFQLISPDSTLHQNDQIRFPLDPKTWVDYLRDFDFVFGTRIHGTVAAILAGTPAILLAHDSRTLELADYHRIPYRLIDHVSAETEATELYAEADYTAFHANACANFERFTGFLERNGLAHIYQPGLASTQFDDKLNAAQLPPLIHPVLAQAPAGQREVLSRLRWLRQGAQGDSERDQYIFQPELRHTPKAETTLSSVDQRLTKKLRQTRQELLSTQQTLTRVEQQLDRARAELDRQSKIIKRLDVPIPARARRYLSRLRRRAIDRLLSRR